MTKVSHSAVAIPPDESLNFVTFETLGIELYNSHI